MGADDDVDVARAEFLEEPGAARRLDVPGEEGEPDPDRLEESRGVFRVLAREKLGRREDRALPARLDD